MPSKQVCSTLSPLRLMVINRTRSRVIPRRSGGSVAESPPEVQK
ncbi:MAG: hypothetical protein PUP92_36645 [Rhizonema sp. PD38]|nr:hypothetical protein [Rhizonema sp. PD38]